MSHILQLDASGRYEDSMSRQLSRELVDKLSDSQTTLTYRDVSQGLPFVNELLIGAYFTPPNDRSDEQTDAMVLSDVIVEELKAADTLVIGLPIYNFSMPAGFKAWCDLAARVGETFKYTDAGPVGLLEGKRAHIAVVSGGTQVGGDIDFLTPWLRQFLSFLGIGEPNFITAAALNLNDKAMSDARSAIASLHPSNG